MPETIFFGQIFLKMAGKTVWRSLVANKQILRSKIGKGGQQSDLAVICGQQMRLAVRNKRK